MAARVSAAGRALYFHLLYTARRQKTNVVKATDTYLKNGIGIGDTKLKKAKAELKKLDLIKYVKRRDHSGKITGFYIHVGYIPTKTLQLRRSARI
jgi:hypothetical protein